AAPPLSGATRSQPTHCPPGFTAVSSISYKLAARRLPREMTKIDALVLRQHRLAPDLRSHPRRAYGPVLPGARIGAHAKCSVASKSPAASRGLARQIPGGADL